MVATLVIFTFVEGCFSIFYSFIIMYIGDCIYMPAFVIFYNIETQSYIVMQEFYSFLAIFCGLMASTTGLPAGFSYLKDIDPSIQIQPRYAIPQNFRGQIVKGYLKPTVIITTAAGYALKGVQSTLYDLGYRLVVYDAYRPQKAVNDFVEWSMQPQDNKTKQQFYPYIKKESIIPDGYVAAKSGHSRGSTVDLTIIALNKKVHQVKLVDYKLRDGRTIKARDDGTEFMGGHFDLFDLSSHHDTLLVDQTSLAKRNLLRDVMTKYGFRWLDTQWWHYTLNGEPFPNTFYDFDVE